MALEDIGYLLFAEFLGMTEYPGAPFTGNIARDLILFLLVPSIFIIMVVFILLGRLAVQQRKIRLLLGVGIYLFILASGYYRAFALISGPYFIFLIFVLGLIYFIPAHFRVRGGGMPGRSAGGSGRSHARGWTPQARVAYLKEELRRLEGELSDARKHGSKEEAALLRTHIEEVREELEDEESTFQPWKRRRAA